MCELSYIGFAIGVFGLLIILFGKRETKQVGQAGLLGGWAIFMVSIFFTGGNCTGWLY